MAVNSPALSATTPVTHGMRRHPLASVLWSAVRTPRGAVGLALTLVIVLVAVIGPILAPHPPNALATLPYARPSGTFPLGADFLGRDVLSRVLAGGWILLVMAVAGTAIG